METPIYLLYIEDDPGAAELLRQHLDEHECVVTWAGDGESGLVQARAMRFDIVLIDYTLPGMNGLDVLQQLRETTEILPATIMLTGTGDEQVAVDAMKSGADDYIVKDVQGIYLELLTQIIRRTLENWEMRRNQHLILAEQARLIEDLQAFGYAVAHDLKQPLSSLFSSLDLLERYGQVQTPELLQNRLTQMRATAVRMNDTLEALILFARIRETNTIELKSIDMRRLVLGVQQQLDEMIKDSQAEITIQEDMPRALGYAPWIERVWMNYLTNAMKYGGTPPRIEIGASPHGESKVAYWVRDYGTPLAHEDKEKLFLPFTRLSERKVEGQGLGLAIVNLIVRRLDGEVIVNSMPGEGNTFGFILTLSE